ncbi:PLP-dependent aminotransferase family protein [Phyllobacterium myrsinacearum]|jgi:DNA-binding transcriptional MocR family regulator|uniref:GntR family transcriptional regulator n=1 Tax=Phyllobacterium myrsinacearum TaxID=28101 RepID=A0A2S9JH18_9HYPH|nr:PLP-dependent aminotransferase family protein [Phyllobacterium myrsinacearum]PRD52254.1 GntR family transcriptional regulator [Phyllobacterium myrsinacearum]PWV92399.1 GntR family transcriptional regulator [Phyllobacterium myrsinacearum]RZV04794.1 GntR family transcriptional regulator [Phyllobacterium myrsinacearum]
MTLWRPDISSLTRPAYLSLADQIARAIGDGTLEAGARLPTHRKMAEDLHLSVQTVSRAYEELIRRGMLSGETGRGSFVKAQRREIDQPYLPERLGEVIDLSILKPVCEKMHHERLKKALGWLSETLPASSALSFRPNVVFPRHRTTAVKWLRECGLDVPASNVSITNGATAAMTVAIMSVAPVGSTIATEATGHHTLVPLASYLGLTLKGIAIDDQGIIPEALDAACRESSIRALFVQPAAINPCATVMGSVRRAQIVEVARKRDIAIVESDILGPLVQDRPPPIAALAPERTLYFTSFTKTVVPGLRIGYLAAPDRYVAAVANRHLVSNWMATPMVAEIATHWVEDGTAMQLVEWQRDALRRRHEIASQVLSGIPFRSHPQSLHIWLPLTDGRTEETFVAQARLQNVAIAPGASFRISQEDWTPAVRISLGSTTEVELLRGLAVVGNLLQGDPEHLLLAI